MTVIVLLLSILSIGLGILFKNEREEKQKLEMKLMDYYKKMFSLEEENKKLVEEKAEVKVRIEIFNKKIKEKHEQEIIDLKKEIVSLGKKNNELEKYATKLGNMSLGTYNDYLNIKSENEILENQIKEIHDVLTKLQAEIEK